MFSLGGLEAGILLVPMLLGMFAIFLVLKHEKGTAIPLWILAIFLIPVFGFSAYLIKFFFIDKKRI